MLTQKQRAVLSTLVLISALLCLFAAVLQAGYENPIQDTDSKGNQLGFNNPLTWELYGILLKSASMKTVASVLGWRGGIFLFFHFVALLFFAVNLPWNARRLSASLVLIQLLTVQLFTFPVGLIGIISLPFFLYDFFAGKIDGETITDLPLPFWTAFQTLWFVVSCATGVMIWRNKKKISSREAAANPIWQ
jgi:hypothetical protein